MNDDNDDDDVDDDDDDDDDDYDNDDNGDDDSDNDDNDNDDEGDLLQSTIFYNLHLQSAEGDCLRCFKMFCQVMFVDLRNCSHDLWKKSENV